MFSFDWHQKFMDVVVYAGNNILYYQTILIAVLFSYKSMAISFSF
jgi:hypothetical protein